ncbi:hypothetical protein PCE1_003606 [Barthelona sp. PCE]
MKDSAKSGLNGSSCTGTTLESIKCEYGQFSFELIRFADDSWHLIMSDDVSNNVCHHILDNGMHRALERGAAPMLACDSDFVVLAVSGYGIGRCKTLMHIYAWKDNSIMSCVGHYSIQQRWSKLTVCCGKLSAFHKDTLITYKIRSDGVLVDGRAQSVQFRSNSVIASCPNEWYMLAVADDQLRVQLPMLYNIVSDTKVVLPYVDFCNIIAKDGEIGFTAVSLSDKCTDVYVSISLPNNTEHVLFVMKSHSCESNDVESTDNELQFTEVDYQPEICFEPNTDMPTDMPNLIDCVVEASCIEEPVSTNTKVIYDCGLTLGSPISECRFDTSYFTIFSVDGNICVSSMDVSENLFTFCTDIAFDENCSYILSVYGEYLAICVSSRTDLSIVHFFIQTEGKLQVLFNENFQNICNFVLGENGTFSLIQDDATVKLYEIVTDKVLCYESYSFLDPEVAFRLCKSNWLECQNMSLPQSVNSKVEEKEEEEEDIPECYSEDEIPLEMKKEEGGRFKQLYLLFMVIIAVFVVTLVVLLM